MASLGPGIISIGRATPEHNASHLIGRWPDIDLVMFAQDSTVNYNYNGTGQVRVASEVCLLGILQCVAAYARTYIGLLIDFFREEERGSFYCINTTIRNLRVFDIPIYFGNLAVVNFFERSIIKLV